MRYLHTLPTTLILLAISFMWGCGGDPLERRGPYDTISQTLIIDNPDNADKPIHATIYAPAKLPKRQVASGTFGVVVLTPGFGAVYNLYEAYTRHLASHGYIVVGMNFRRKRLSFNGYQDDMARQISHVIDYTLDQSEFVAGHVDPTKIGLVGHSMGGKIAFYAAALDPRVSVVVAMDPSNSGGPPCMISETHCNQYPVAPNSETGHPGMLPEAEVASLIFRAAPDAATNPDPHNNAWWFFWGADNEGTWGVNSPALFYDMGNVGHTAWIQPMGYHTPRITKRTMVAWLKTHLDGMEGYDDYFDTGNNDAGFDAGNSDSEEIDLGKNQADIDQGRIVSITSR